MNRLKWEPEIFFFLIRWPSKSDFRNRTPHNVIHPRITLRCLTKSKMSRLLIHKMHKWTIKRNLYLWWVIYLISLGQSILSADFSAALKKPGRPLAKFFASALKKKKKSRNRLLVIRSLFCSSVFFSRGPSGLEDKWYQKRCYTCPGHATRTDLCSNKKPPRSFLFLGVSFFSRRVRTRAGSFDNVE